MICLGCLVARTICWAATSRFSFVAYVISTPRVAWTAGVVHALSLADFLFGAFLSPADAVFAELLYGEVYSVSVRVVFYDVVGDVIYAKEVDVVVFAVVFSYEEVAVFVSDVDLSVAAYSADVKFLFVNTKNFVLVVRLCADEWREYEYE